MPRIRRAENTRSLAAQIAGCKSSASSDHCVHACCALQALGGATSSAVAFFWRDSKAADGGGGVPLGFMVQLQYDGLLFVLATRAGPDGPVFTIWQPPQPEDWDHPQSADPIFVEETARASAPLKKRGRPRPKACLNRAAVAITAHTNQLRLGNGGNRSGTAVTGPGIMGFLHAHTQPHALLQRNFMQQAGPQPPAASRQPPNGPGTWPLSVEAAAAATTLEAMTAPEAQAAAAAQPAAAAAAVAHRGHSGLVRSRAHLEHSRQLLLPLDDADTPNPHS